MKAWNRSEIDLQVEKENRKKKKVRFVPDFILSAEIVVISLVQLQQQHL